MSNATDSLSPTASKRQPFLVGACRESARDERRVALTPASARYLSELGYRCLLEQGAGVAAGFSDAAYREAGVEIVAARAVLLAQVDIIIQVRPPSSDEIAAVPSDKILISFFWPAQNAALLAAANARRITVLAMDMVPRISRAQKMDALSSMANIAGYRAVIEAGNHFGRFFTGQITAAGKVPPAKVLVIGAGVAGLAAIGTAQSLGAIVRAFDVRPEVAEQIESMGAEFLLLDFAEDGSGDGGYAKPASEAFIAKEMALFREQAPEVDIVITTALIPGRPAPLLWPAEMVGLMQAGSVVVDLAAEQGGNCEMTVKDALITTDNGVKVVGYTDFPSRMATQSSLLYATNIRHMLDDLTPQNDGVPLVNMADDVIRSATVCHQGDLTYPPPKLTVPAIAKPAAVTPVDPAVALRTAQAAAKKATTIQSVSLLAAGLMMLLIGSIAPASFMQHLIVFVLACFVGFQVIWKVSHALHTPLMAVTNAISGIIIIGALLQVSSTSWLVTGLAAVAVLIASINIVGGFVVTRRMLAMFQKSEG